MNILAVKMEADDARVMACAWCIHDWLKNRSQYRQAAAPLRALARLMKLSDSTACRYRIAQYTQLNQLYVDVNYRIARHSWAILPQSIREDLP